mmetsp:Transcript_25519/g.74934  ORF Transcript_25519/g.74934 Transcript_25519/m.74934 type:complete len:242 (+) Transcript_25519:933-1658(+)
MSPARASRPSRPWPIPSLRTWTPPSRTAPCPAARSGRAVGAVGAHRSGRRCARRQRRGRRTGWQSKAVHLSLHLEEAGYSARRAGSRAGGRGTHRAQGRNARSGTARGCHAQDRGRAAGDCMGPRSSGPGARFGTSLSAITVPASTAPASDGRPKNWAPHSRRTDPGPTGRARTPLSQNWRRENAASKLLSTRARQQGRRLTLSRSAVRLSLPRWAGGSKVAPGHWADRLTAAPRAGRQTY